LHLNLEYFRPMLGPLPVNPLKLRRITSYLLMAMTALSTYAQEATINGFVVEETSIPITHIVRAAPAKDSIASLDEPKFLNALAVDWLEDEDEVISVTIGFETRAYPLRILVWHEVVNDQFGDQPLVVTYSALSGSAMVFKPGVNQAGTPRSFGVSGLLYNSCLLMYDRENEELWSQLRMQGVSGSVMKEPLEMIPGTRMSWSAWKKKNLMGQVLSNETGHDIDYSDEWPYGDYAQQAETIFPFDVNRNELQTKERVIGVVEGESARCWPLEKLKEKGELYDAIGPRPIRVQYDEKNDRVKISDISTGDEIPVVSAFWFAWQAFYADTSIWTPLR
jgi:hypothetical protein